MLSVLTTWVFCILKIGILFKYTSPTILLNAIIIVTVFSRFNINSKLISSLSSLTFGIYLFQMNQIVWDKLKNAFAFVAQKSIIIGVIYVLAISLAIFTIGLIVEFLRNKTSKFLRIPELSKKIAVLVDKLITKCTVLLK